MRRDVIVIGASAGGLEALRTVVRGLPPTLPAALLVVLHTPATSGSVLPQILSRAGVLPARHPVDHEPLRHSSIWVAAPDHHLAVTDDHVTLTRGPRENGVRPAVDVLFRTAARSLGSRVIAVVLSGALDDGTAGLVAVAARGGVCVVQDPRDALYDGMPSSALEHVAVDHVVPAAEIAPLLVRLCTEDVTAVEAAPSPELDREADVGLMRDEVLGGPGRPMPAAYSCPDCSGVLWEVEGAVPVRYRCRVGHAWSAENLLAQQSEQLDAALSVALRALEEKAALAATLRDRAQERGNAPIATRFAEQSDEAGGAARVIRSLLHTPPGASERLPTDEAVTDRIER